MTPTPTPNRRSPYFTVKEAADYLRLSPGTIYNLIWQGRLPRRRGKLRFTEEDLERYLDERANRSPQ
jgi:excisionase family DNA binding protein